MKRFLMLALLIAMLLVTSLSGEAGHAVVGNGQTVQCDCTPKSGEYVCLDDQTDEPLPLCGSFAASARRGHQVK